MLWCGCVGEKKRGLNGVKEAIQGGKQTFISLGGFYYVNFAFSFTLPLSFFWANQTIYKRAACAFLVAAADPT